MSVQLTSAQELAWEYPAKPEYGIEEHRRSIARSIHEENGKVVLVAGPCSVHDTEATLEYAGRLSELARGDRVQGCRGHAGIRGEVPDGARMEGLPV